MNLIITFTWKNKILWIPHYKNGAFKRHISIGKSELKRQ